MEARRETTNVGQRRAQRDFCSVESMSRHATVRSRQRAISPMEIDLLLRWGAVERAGDGASKYFYDKPARRRLRAYAGQRWRSIEEHLDIYAIVAPDGKVVTVAHRVERVKRP